MDKNIKITDEIRAGIREYCAVNNVADSAIAELVGVATSTVNSWKNGKIKSIRANQYSKLEPLIRLYLKDKSYIDVIADSQIDLVVAWLRQNPKSLASLVYHITLGLDPIKSISVEESQECLTQRKTGA